MHSLIPKYVDKIPANKAPTKLPRTTIELKRPIQNPLQIGLDLIEMQAKDVDMKAEKVIASKPLTIRTC